MKVYPIKIEMVDDVEELIAHVTAFDERTCSVDMTNSIFTKASWIEFSEQVAKAIDMLELIE